jgi:xanthine dehydrogenase accessory factor
MVGCWRRRGAKLNAESSGGTKMPHDEVYEAMSNSFEDGSPVALATVAQTLGSTPRKTGAKMLVREDGTFVGTIGGGCGEAEVWQEAMDALEDGDARMVTVDLTEPVDGEDKICGGIMRIFVERLDA